MADGPSAPPDPEALSRYLTDHLGAPSALTGAPEPITGGYVNSLWRVRLRNDKLTAADDLVVRLFRADWPAEMLRREWSWHDYLWRSGYPTARPLLAEPGSSVLGAPFIVMEYVSGEPLMAWLESLRARVLWVPRVLAEAMRRLHRVPVPAASFAGPALGVAGALDDLELRNAEIGDELVTRAVRELRTRRPGSYPLVVAHLDLNPPNVLMEGTEMVAVVDWTTCCVADPRLDVADVVTVLRTADVDLPDPVARMAASGRRILARRFVDVYHRGTRVDLSVLGWWETVAACRRRLMAIVDLGDGEEPKGFASPRYIDNLGRLAESKLAEIGPRRLRW